MQFTVIDTKTGEYPELSKIARTEDWAKNLVYCDVEGFYIGEGGCLILVDDCGNTAYPPSNRFLVKVEEVDTCVAETLNEELNDIVREVKAELERQMRRAQAAEDALDDIEWDARRGRSHDRIVRRIEEYRASTAPCETESEERQ